MADERRRAAVRPQLHFRRLVDGAMLYDPDSGRVHHFNATAAWVWEGCLRGWDRERLVEELCRNFDVGAARARADIERLLGQFAQEGLWTG